MKNLALRAGVSYLGVLAMVALPQVLSACTPVIKLWPIGPASSTPLPSPTPSTGLSNPATLYCTQNNGRILVKPSLAGETGYCLFPDLSSCEEWSFYRNACKPGDHPNSY